MKKRAGVLLLCLTYVVILSGMLMVHVRRIAGEEERVLAMAEVLLILLFSVVIVVLSLQRQKTEVPERRSYVENYEQFLNLISGDGLSEREKEVAWLIYRGFTNRQIAEELFIAETTVKKHVTHIFEKCHVSGRKELKERWNKKV